MVWAALVVDSSAENAVDTVGQRQALWPILGPVDANQETKAVIVISQWTANNDEHHHTARPYLHDQFT